jgi:hypothetical protein
VLGAGCQLAPEAVGGRDTGGDEAFGQVVVAGEPGVEGHQPSGLGPPDVEDGGGHGCLTAAGRCALEDDRDQIAETAGSGDGDGTVRFHAVMVPEVTWD